MTESETFKTLCAEYTRLPPTSTESVTRALWAAYHAGWLAGEASAEAAHFVNTRRVEEAIAADRAEIARLTGAHQGMAMILEMITAGLSDSAVHSRMAELNRRVVVAEELVRPARKPGS